MHVFVTGATGLSDLPSSRNHQRRPSSDGLARSDASAKKLTAAGARVLRGDIEDLECLRLGRPLPTARFTQPSITKSGT